MPGGFFMLFAVAMTAFLPQVTFGCVYEFETMTTFTCLHGDYIIRLESRYNATLQDRKWCFECTTGGGYVNYDCFWHVQYPGQPTFGVECPFGSLITGMYSDYSPKDKYRIYTAECCKPSKPPAQPDLDCEMTDYINELNQDFVYQVPPGYAIRGLFGFYGNLGRKTDRHWVVYQCAVEH